MVLIEPGAKAAAAGKARRQAVVRLAGTAAVLLFLVLLAGSALGMGVSSWLVAKARSLDALNRAVNLSPQDPGAYRARAAELRRRGELRKAVDDLRQAISLRPGDYHLWSELAAALNRQGMSSEAIAAATEAERLAPSYTSTQWERGMLLMKTGHRDEAFDQLRKASLNRPDLFMSTLKIAAKEYGRECAAIERAVSPRNYHETMATGSFFIRNCRAAEAMAVIGRLNYLSQADRQRLVAELLEAKLFAEAYSLWLAGPGKVSPNESSNMVDDGGFESGELIDDIGFGWNDSELRDTKVSITGNAAHTGKAGMQVDWAGNPEADDETISQLVVVEPNTNYRLDFVARAQNLITAGTPVIEVTDVSE